MKLYQILGDNSRQDDRDSYGRVQSAGIRFEAGGFMPCEDDEDLCDVGSGGGQDGWGYSANSNIFDVSNQIDSKLKHYIVNALFINFDYYLYLMAMF